MKQGGLLPERSVDEIEAAIADILDRFGGVITAIQERTDDDRVAWIETARPRAERRRRASASGAGRPEAVPLEETILLGKFSSYEKAQRKGSVKPWQLVWSKSGEPLNAGLFTSKELAEDWRKRR